MPMDPRHYPPNWIDLALQIKTEANWTCQHCDRPCRQPNEAPDQFMDRIATTRLSECPRIADYLEAPQRYTLTVAHLDQNPMNNDRTNLKALCSVCHLHHDRPHRIGNSYRKRERNGQLTLEI